MRALVAMVGLVVGPFAGGLAPTFGSLMAARMIAGAFGGPATSLSMKVLRQGAASVAQGRLQQLTDPAHRAASTAQRARSA